jgi:hypothetical protein
MKKMLTLSIALVAVTGAFAQYSRSYPDRAESRDVILGNGGNDRSVYNNGNSRYDGYIFSAKERDVEIQRINRDFDARARDLQRNWRMRASGKNYQVRLLEQQRRQQVQAVRDRFQDSRNRYKNNSSSRANRRW